MATISDLDDAYRALRVRRDSAKVAYTAPKAQVGQRNEGFSYDVAAQVLILQRSGRSFVGALGGRDAPRLLVRRRGSR